MRDSLREWKTIICKLRRFEVLPLGNLLLPLLYTITNTPFPQGISIVCLLYNTEFLNNSLAIVLNPNEIHSLCQSRHINLLGFIGNVA